MNQISPLQLSQKQKKLRDWSSLFAESGPLAPGQREEIFTLLTTYSQLIDKVSILIERDPQQALSSVITQLLSVERSLTCLFDQRRLATSSVGTRSATGLSHR